MMSVILALTCAAISSITDLRSGLVYDRVTGWSAAAIALCSLRTGTSGGACLGALLCGGALYALHLGTRGRGLGLGDVKLAGVIGAGLGGAQAIEAIAAAFVAAALWTAPQLAVGRLHRGDQIRFAPFLAIGALGFVLATSVARHG